MRVRFPLLVLDPPVSGLPGWGPPVSDLPGSGPQVLGPQVRPGVPGPVCSARAPGVRPVDRCNSRTADSV